MKDSVFQISLVICLLVVFFLPVSGGLLGAEDDIISDSMVFGFDLSPSELGRKGEEMYQNAVNWDENSVPQNLEDFPVIPAYIFSCAEEIERLDTSLVIKGNKAIWISGAEDIYDGDYGRILSDDCYGWTESGADIFFFKTKMHTYESLFFQNASETSYIRQERAWSNSGWEYRIEIDFFEANKEYGDRITAINMYNPQNGMDLSWQLNSQFKDVIMIQVFLSHEDKYFSIDYDTNTGGLIRCEMY